MNGTAIAETLRRAGTSEDSHPNHGTRLNQNVLGETAQIPGSLLSREAANLGGTVTALFPDDGCQFLVVI